MLTRLSSLPSHTQQTAYTYSATQMQSLLHATRKVETLMTAYFSPLEVLAGKATVEQAAAQTVVTVPYYSEAEALDANTVNVLGQQLAVVLERPVQLVVVRLLTPSLDASVLSQYLSKELHDSTFRKVMLALFSSAGIVTTGSSSVPGTLIGVKVRLAGRLLQEATQPRQTIKTASLGCFSAHPNHLLQSSSYTATNLKGAYTVKV